MTESAATATTETTRVCAWCSTTAPASTMERISDGPSVACRNITECAGRIEVLNAAAADAADAAESDAGAAPDADTMIPLACGHRVRQAPDAAAATRHYGFTYCPQCDEVRPTGTETGPR